MGLLGKKGEGGLADVIRCDQQEYLVWKWRPSGEATSTKKENSIRWGSSLRVKDGELAVFVYKQQDGIIQDFIKGPFDETIKTANFPVLAGILGAAFGGGSPFQAEVYFINLQGNNQIKFGVPYFDVSDPRVPDFSVPVAVRGTITFNVTDYEAFIKLNRLINFELDDFKKQIKDALNKYVKAEVTNVPYDHQIPVLHMERKLLDINTFVSKNVSQRFTDDFGVNLKALDLSTIEVDKESEGYRELYRVTAAQVAESIGAQTKVNIKNMQDTQTINAENMAGMAQMQREEAQRAQKLQTESNFMGVHSLNQQADVLKTGAQSLGSMGSMGDGAGGMNPAGMMTGMAMGGAMGGQMAGMMNQMGQNINQGQNAPPPPPNVQYSVSVNGQTSGPFTMQQLQQLVQSGELTPKTHVWTQGMAQWETAANVAELGQFFQNQTPPPPPPPAPEQ